MDLVSGLYINEDSELWTKGSCLGTNGPKGEKFECSGSAAICHKFCEAKLQSQVELRLKEHRNARSSLIENASQPIQLGVVLASSLLDCIVDHLMKMYLTINWWTLSAREVEQALHISCSPLTEYLLRETLIIFHPRSKV